MDWLGLASVGVQRPNSKSIRHVLERETFSSILKLVNFTDRPSVFHIDNTRIKLLCKCEMRVPKGSLTPHTFTIKHTRIHAIIPYLRRRWPRSQKCLELDSRPILLTLIPRSTISSSYVVSKSFRHLRKLSSWGEVGRSYPLNDQTAKTPGHIRL